MHECACVYMCVCIFLKTQKMLNNDETSLQDCAVAWTKQQKVFLI